MRSIGTPSSDTEVKVADDEEDADVMAIDNMGVPGGGARRGVDEEKKNSIFGAYCWSSGFVYVCVWKYPMTFVREECILAVLLWFFFVFDETRCFKIPVVKLTPPQGGGCRPT